MPTIEHDANGPFIRAYNATPTGQTETVYAIEAVFEKQGAEYWNLSVTPPTDQDARDLAQAIYHLARSRGYGAVITVRPVSRQVTIQATEWQPS